MSTIQPQAEELAPARRVGGMSHLGALLGMALRVSDQLVLVFAGLLACWLQADNFAMDLVQEQTIARAVLFGLIVFSVSSIYKSWRGRSLAQELVTLGFLWLIVLALSLGYSLAFKLQIPMSRLWWGLWFAGAMLLSSASRLVVRGVAGWVRARGYDVRRAVIVGVGLDSARVLQALTEEARAGIQVVGWFDTRVDSRFLRGMAHDLKALLQIGGKGVTPAFMAELDEVLERHELIKVKVAAEDREAREAMVAELVETSGSVLVQRIGHVAVLYRPAKEKRQIILPRG